MEARLAKITKSSDETIIYSVFSRLVGPNQYWVLSKFNASNGEQIYNSFTSSSSIYNIYSLVNVGDYLYWTSYRNSSYHLFSYDITNDTIQKIYKTGNSVRFLAKGTSNNW
jgi:hypothetical protein